MIHIRPETPDDRAAIYAVLLAAFGRPEEAKLVDALRDGGHFDPRLSLVCQRGGQIVGHILLSRITIGPTPALALAPLAVTPTYQRHGYGSALVEAGLQAAQELAHRAVVVLGHPDFYPRFGFVPATDRGITAPFDVPREAFLVRELLPGALEGISGVVTYPAPFFDL